MGRVERGEDEGERERGMKESKDMDKEWDVERKR